MITIIIPTCNAAEHLASLLAKLKTQTLHDYEILVIDSSSQDNTVAVARSCNAKVISIPQNEFDHGGTRTLAAKEAAGQILVYLTQDVLPCNDTTIESLIKPLIDDQQISAVFGRQIAYPNASVFAQYLRMFNYPEESYVRTLADRQTYGLKTVFFSDSFSAYRKSALEEIGFFRKGLIFGEDTCAAACLLLSGKKIAYAADAKVLHSHNYTIGRDFKRYFDMGVFHKNENWLLTEFSRPQSEAVKYIKSEIKFLWKQNKQFFLPELILRNTMKFLGYTLGFKYTFLPKNISKIFSANRHWWDRP